MSLSVSSEINRIPYARISLRDGEASKRSFDISSKNDFLPGKKVSIQVGRDSKNTRVFKGIIVRHAIKIRNNGQSELLLECYDETIKMTIGRHSRYFENIKDSEVFNELGRKYPGLKTDVKSTTLKHREIVQHHISDWDFMLLRAEANGMLVHVSESVIRIAKPDTTPKPTLQVTYGASVIELDAEMDARSQWKKVKAASWDFANQELFNADTVSTAVDEPGNFKGDQLAKITSPENFELHHSGHLIQQELQDWVDATMMRSRLGKIRGRAKFSGVAEIKTGDCLQLDGLGDRFNGKAYVTSVRNDMGDGVWDTHIQFGLDPERHAMAFRDIPDAEAGGLIGSIKGLQIGKVVQLENDPDGQDRILVKVPVIDNKARGTWMRVASLDAGKDRGAFFRPDLDDEVIIGFINDDPRDAIVLGMLHSSAKPAPITAKDVNYEKGFTTRSKLHILFNDDTKTITIDTPWGNSIVLDEKSKSVSLNDQNKNSIKMSESGIKIDSPKDIEINANMNLTLKAGISLSIGGSSVSMKADGDVSISGAMAKLAGQGITEITGGMVKIN
jgi:Rhs element Vgr protein